MDGLVEIVDLLYLGSIVFRTSHGNRSLKDFHFETIYLTLSFGTQFLRMIKPSENFTQDSSAYIA